MDIFKMYNEQNQQSSGETAPAHEQSLEQVQTPTPTHQDQYQQPPSQQELDTQAQQQGEGRGPGNIAGNEQQIKNRMENDHLMGGGSESRYRNLEADPDSWSPEYTARGFLEESGTSIMRGIGNHILKGTGDMIQVAGSVLPGIDLEQGSMLSRSLQEMGENMAEEHRALIPDELMSENIGFSSFANPKLWSIHVAEMIPQLVEFIALSKGGSALARKGASAVLKKQAGKGILGKATQSAAGEAVYGTGKGLAGKLATDQGLNALGSNVFGTIGGGVTGNVLSGMLNAADVVNTYKDIKDPVTGERLYSEEDVANMAAGTMRNNLAWLGVDMASYGLTFGGGWNKLKGLNPLGKGGAIRTAAERSKIAGKLFQYDIAPVAKSMAKLAGKAGFEGFEESFQETFEEWAKQKAVDRVTGDPSSHLLNPGSFWDFYKSKENRGTLVLSAAVGALGGGVFNFKDAINNKADESFRTWDAIENFSKITKKQGSDEDLIWQKRHTYETIANIVADNRTDLYEDFRNSIVKNENITEEEAKEFDKMFDQFKELNTEAKALNVKGRQALLRHKANEIARDEEIEGLINVSKGKVEKINSFTSKSQEQKEKLIEEEEQILQQKLKAAYIARAKAVEAQENLIIGKKAKVDNIEVKLDKFGEKITIAGLSDEQYDLYVREGKVPNRSAKKVEGNIKDAFSSLTKGSKDFINNMMSKFQKKEEAPKQEQTLAQASLTPEEIKEIEGEHDVTIMQDEDGSYAVDSNTTSEESVKGKDIARQKIDNILAGRKPKAPTNASGNTNVNGQEVQTPKSQEQAKLEAGQAIEDAEISKDEVIKDDVWKNFTENNLVDQNTINEIAKQIYTEGSISDRQDEIRSRNENAVQQAITKLILDTTKTDAKNDKFQSEEAFTKNPKGPKPAPGTQSSPSKEETPTTEDADFKVVDEEDLNDAEVEFVKAEVMRESRGTSMEQDKASKVANAIKNWNPNKRNVKNAKRDFMDKRENDYKKGIFRQNLNEFLYHKKLFNKIRSTYRNPQNPMVSENELDNYLNRTTIRNTKSPSEIHKMAVVNHRLKKMFPDMDRPVQVHIAKNLYSSMGSIGVGAALANTIYIDDKAWEQDEVFMHEMSHIYYQITKNQPETQAIVKTMLADKDLVKEIKGKYDDYVLYDAQNPDGSWIRAKKSDIYAAYAARGVDKNAYDKMLKQEIEDGSIKTVPLRQQDLIVEEMFAKRLQTPLAGHYDKLFNRKNPEVRRQKQAKKWWGMLRKKGEIIKNDDPFYEIFNQNEERIGRDPNSTHQDWILSIFRTATENMNVSPTGMDARIEEIDAETQKQLDNIQGRLHSSLASDKTFSDDFSDKVLRGLEDTNADEDSNEDFGNEFFAKDFNDKAKKATLLIRRFGKVYNKALRTKFVRDNKKADVDFAKQDLFDKEFFQSTMFNLARETPNVLEFIRQIENSQYEEMQAFDRYMDKKHPASKLKYYNSMYTIFSNSRHVNSIQNYKKDNGEFETQESLSQTELNQAEGIVGRLIKNFKNEGPLLASLQSIKEGNGTNQDYARVLTKMGPNNLDLERILKSGVLTYKGKNIPIDTLITGFLQNGMMDNSNGVGFAMSKSHPIVKSIIATNRQFTPQSSVVNAQGNLESLKMTNNNLTNEIDQMVDFMQYGNNGNPATKEEFMERFSHMNYQPEGKRSRSYEHNQFLEDIYDSYQNGVMPTISKYDGVKDASNKKGNTYKDSTSSEQRIEDLMLFENSSRKRRNGVRNKQALVSLGAFADSPRKFLMNMKMIKYEDLLENNGNFKQDGKLINSVIELHKKIYPGQDINGVSPANDKAFKQAFKKAFKNSIKKEIGFINENGPELSRLKHMKQYFREDGTLNKKGQTMVAEYVINNTVHGYNTMDVFLPGATNNDVIKRMKMNSSPVFSVKNENFGIEPLFFSDEIINGDVKGTDAGMYILEEDAEKFRRLGYGVFDLNDGFKFLGAHIEKVHPDFKGKSAYIKGYTTVVGEGHPLYPAMKARKDKYNEYHQNKYGKAPSMDLNDGTHNQVVIAIPQSSDKTGFNPTKYTTKNADGSLEYTEEGELLNPEALRQNHDIVNQTNDKLFYKNGEFRGISSTNFGPQQSMDKTRYEANTPVQMVNSVIVNAGRNGALDKAVEIQQLISNQKMKNFNKELEQLEKQTSQEYSNYIEKGLSKEDMDQGQRVMIELGGSFAVPYNNEIGANQLAKSLRKAGNKLATPGTYAQQKPDIGIQTQRAKPSDRLKGYQKNADGSFGAAEIVLGKDMEANLGLKSRKYFTLDNMREELKAYKKKYNVQDGMDALRSMTMAEAQRRALDSTGSKDNWKKFIGEYKNAQGVTTGYFVKGDQVIASRVPGHGPSSTGVFEIVGFDNSPGNTVMVPAEFNEIIGADNDGDALFIQSKGDKKKYADWNKAFDMIAEYWLSKDMGTQAQARMVFEEEAQQVAKEVDTFFNDTKEKKENSYVMPFSPEKRAADYNNTMVSKRNVGPIFNLHKIANLLAAYDTEMSKMIVINGKTRKAFKDEQVGDNSRNQKSAILANIILDNANSDGVADKLGLDENNIAQAALLTNLGLSLKEVGMILNSPAAKLWTKHKRNNSSIYHNSKKRDTIIKDIYKELKLGKVPTNADRDAYAGFKINTNNVKDAKAQKDILEMMVYLDQMNQELMKMSAVMSGHKQIHVNPLVLEKQLNDYKEMMRGQLDENGNRTTTLNYSEELRTNPDLQNYLRVAEEVLKHTKTLNPAYRESTNKILNDLWEKIGQENVNINTIEEFSSDVQTFITSRLMGLNNSNPRKIAELMSMEGDNSIFVKLDKYLDELRVIPDTKFDPKNPLKSRSKIENSILFRKVLDMNLIGKGQTKYIKTSSSFMDESFNEEEQRRAQQEFEDLPVELQNGLIIYDMVAHGWKGKHSLYPFFGKAIINRINEQADKDLATKNDVEISPIIQEKLERVIAQKAALRSNNPFEKVRIRGDKTMSGIRQGIEKNPKLMRRIRKGQPVYVNVITKQGKSTTRELYEVPGLTKQEVEEIKATRNSNGMAEEFAFAKMQKVDENFVNIGTYKNPNMGNLELATIRDKNIQPPEGAKKNTDPREGNIDVITEATISYEEAREREIKAAGSVQVMDAREDYDAEMFSRVDPLPFGEWATAMEFNTYTTEAKKRALYKEYRNNKEAANKLAEKVLPKIEDASVEQLMEMYEEYGQLDAYAYSIIMTPVIKKIAEKATQEQVDLWKKNGVEGTAKGFDGKDISSWKAYMTSGSTIPSNHPTSQAMARIMEREFKKFTAERKKYMGELEEKSRALYADRLGYSTKRSIKNTFRRLRDLFVTGQKNVYDQLYGNLVVKDEVIDKKGNLTYNYKLRPQEEIDKAYQEGKLSLAEKEFYDHFKKVTNELKPDRLKKERKDYIPHTAMSDLEAFSARGLLGLMVKSRPEDDALYDVKMTYTDFQGNKRKMNFKEIEDLFKMKSGIERHKNDIKKIKEYRALKRKAKKLLKEGKNEDGTPIQYSIVQNETALGFGAINRFANERSVRATQMPSMDLNKALSDYIHSSLFVDGNKNFQGMRKLQSYIDGALAFNRENNLENMNKHVQTVWKDYFLRGKRQESVLGKKADKVIRRMTKLNLYYALGYQANKNTGGLYAIGNILVGKYHNIKDIGGKAWIKGEARFWGLDNGFEGGIEGVLARRRRMSKIMQNINFMDINVHDEVNVEKKYGLDKIMSEIALSPMIYSEKWIQQTHILGMLTDEELNRFDAEGNYKPGTLKIPEERMNELEDKVKSQHGRGYQPTDQRALQMYSYGNMMLQFSKFLPTMVHDRFSEKDVNIYAREHVGSLRQAGKMVRYVVNNPTDFVRYRASLSEEERKKLDSALKGLGMVTIAGFVGYGLGSEYSKDLFGDANYYMNYDKLSGKVVPPAIQSTDNLFFNWF